MVVTEAAGYWKSSCVVIKCTCRSRRTSSVWCTE